MKELSRDFIARLEIQEDNYWKAYYSLAGKELVETLGAKFKSIAGASCYALSNVDILAFNRVIGIGLNNTIVKENIKKIIEFYRNAEVKRFFVQVNPVAEASGIIDLLKECGFKYHNNWAKFIKKLDKINYKAESEVELSLVQPGELSKFDDILTTVFEFDSKAAYLFSQTYKQTGWKHYFARLKGKPIAAASLFINDEFASLAIAGTLPEHRGFGAQSALISARINDAIEAGCKYIVVETAEDTVDNPSASFRNMKKLGFELAYLRPNFIYNF